MIWLSDKRLWIYDMSLENFHIVRESVTQWGNANANYNDDAKTPKSLKRCFYPEWFSSYTMPTRGFIPKWFPVWSS